MGITSCFSSFMVWFWDFSTKIVLINIFVDKKSQKADFQSKNLSFWVFLAWLSRESQNYKIATFLRPSKWPKMVKNSENRPKFGLNGLQILCRIEKKWVLGNSRTSGFSLFPHACPVCTLGRNKGSRGNRVFERSWEWV